MIIGRNLPTKSNSPPPPPFSRLAEVFRITVSPPSDYERHLSSLFSFFFFPPLFSHGINGARNDFIEAGDYPTDRLDENFSFLKKNI